MQKLNSVSLMIRTHRRFYKLLKTETILLICSCWHDLTRRKRAKIILAFFVIPIPFSKRQANMSKCLRQVFSNGDVFKEIFDWIALKARSCLIPVKTAEIPKSLSVCA
ncbi:hypothetical protein ACEQPO_02820 [Bacillus sp. SL00103]